VLIFDRPWDLPSSLHMPSMIRLRDSFGAGPYCPVSSNRTPEDKAKDRRVGLVEQQQTREVATARHGEGARGPGNG